MEEDRLVAVLRGPADGGLAPLGVVGNEAPIEGPEVLLVRQQVHCLAAIGLPGQRVERRSDATHRGGVADDGVADVDDAAREIHPEVVLGDILRPLGVEVVVDVPLAADLPEVAAKHAHATPVQGLQAIGRGHRPVEVRRRRKGLRPGKAMDFLGHLVVVADQHFGRRVLVRPPGRVRVGVECQFQPAGVVLPLALVTVGKLRQGETIFRGEVDVHREPRAVLLVQVAEDLQVETVEQRGIFLPGNVAEKEDVVVHGEVIPGLRVPVPDHADATFTATRVADCTDHDLGHLLAQDDFAGELLSLAPGGLAVDRHVCRRGRGAHHGDRQAVGRRFPMPVVQDRPVERLFDLHQAGRGRHHDSGRHRGGRRAKGGRLEKSAAANRRARSLLGIVGHLVLPPGISRLAAVCVGSKWSFVIPFR